ncbi:MaoC/PaaZ C-terminal domain-containing protein [Mycolicibacter kumamotonensis]|uniref:Dehydratase n=1 Tax=Mycolicibacter kumamotonensis TaxID=354243 RepID=A0A7K3LDL0_9MYCO|nr:MaoC/PaaZ C-terminal domain-containing protein [Mycolicibacter kumamotonensis]NDJ89706.1 hypothetical protein [Mycolicibacter kumamotonensis]
MEIAEDDFDLLSACVEDWRPTQVEATDVIAVDRARSLASTLDLDQAIHAGDALPMLWHWIYFLDWPRTDELGSDGHPLHGHFLPPIPNRRRMFAGGRVRITEPLLIGRPAVRHTEIADTVVKRGSTGALAFVTVRHRYSQDGVLRFVEEQDHVYRTAGGSAGVFARSTDPPVAGSAEWSLQPSTHPALLFRFSALTGNAHRIHYDEPYAVCTEGFPGLVVHGPLLALYMAELIRRYAPRRAVRLFDYRFYNPVFAGDAIRVEGQGDDPVALAVTSGSGIKNAVAQAILS